MKHLTVVIPCYNEEAGIAAVINGFDRRMLRSRGFTLEIIVVDNNSSDKTAETARRAGARVLHEGKQGKGNALRTGLYNISEHTDYVVMLDGDGTYRPDETLRLLELLDSGFADAVVGSRLGGKIQPNAMRRSTRLGNWFFSLLMRYVYRVNVTDTLSGYFAWKRDVAIELRQHLKADDFSIALEMIAKMARMGWEVYSVPVTYSPSAGVARRRHAYDAWRILRALLRNLAWRPHIERVAFVSDTVWPYFKGGKEKRLDEITRRMARNGRRVDVYTFKWWQGSRHIVTKHGVHMHAIARRREIYKADRRRIVPALTFTLACLKLLFSRFDVIDADSMPFFPLYVIRLVAWLRRKKMYATWHEVWGAAYWKKYMGKAGGTVAAIIEKGAMKLPDVIVSNSEHTTKRLHAAGNRRPVMTVPLGVDTDAILTSPPHELQSDVIFAGRLIKHNNVDVLIRAIGYMKRTHPDVRCLIVGSGPERPRLEALIAELQLEPNVTIFNFLEDHSELYSLMKSSRMLVQPSSREGFGLVVVEANACGIPVITVRHAHNAAQDLIIEGENGFLTTLEPKAMARQIRKVLRVHQAMQPGKALNERFAAYRWQHAAESVEKVLMGSQL